MRVSQVVEADLRELVIPNGLSCGHDRGHEPAREPLRVPHTAVRVAEHVGVVPGERERKRAHRDLWALIAAKVCGSRLTVRALPDFGVPMMISSPRPCA